MPRKSVVAAIVLNYNGGEMVRQCIDCLLQGTIQPDVFVVDNASADGSDEAIDRLFPRAVVIRNSHNLGFAAGMNVGVRRALDEGYRYVWLINQDALVAPETLEFLLQRAEQFPSEGLWSPAIFSSDGVTPWFLGGRVSYFRMRAIHEPTRPEKRGEAWPTEYLTGCALFIARETIQRIGLLDEHYFLYYEDAAYSIAARRAGLIPTVVGGAHVTHHETSEQNENKIYWLVRSGTTFFRRESPRSIRPWIETVLFLRRAKNWLERLIRPRRIVQTVARAYTDASRKERTQDGFWTRNIN